jgi:hypothetical protein
MPKRDRAPHGLASELYVEAPEILVAAKREGEMLVSQGEILEAARLAEEVSGGTLTVRSELQADEPPASWSIEATHPRACEGGDGCHLDSLIESNDAPASSRESRGT